MRTVWFTLVLLICKQLVFAGSDLPKMGQAKVHVFGDSHAQYSFAPVNGVVVHWLGPITMHRVGRDGLSFLNIAKSGVKEKDTVIFCFGEIDVRCHIGKQYALGRDVKEVIDTLVKGYIDAINANRALFKSLHCVIFAVLPPAEYMSDASFPVVGSLQERIYFTQVFNKKLYQEAAKNGIAMLDVNKEYATFEGSLNPKLSDGSVHIAKGSFVKEKLTALLKTFYK